MRSLTTETPLVTSLLIWSLVADSPMQRLPRMIAWANPDKGDEHLPGERETNGDGTQDYQWDVPGHHSKGCTASARLHTYFFILPLPSVPFWALCGLCVLCSGSDTAIKSIVAKEVVTAPFLLPILATATKRGDSR